MIVTRNDTVLVQGITGKQGSYWTARMREYGTRIMAGVTPGKGGQTVADVPVYDSVTDAQRDHHLDVTVLFTPPLMTKDAALEALAAGIKKMVILAEHVPYQDTMEIVAEARDRGAQVLGPNTAGLVVPGQASIGIMPCFAPTIFRPGAVGVISRSGSLGTLFCVSIVRAGFGESAFIGVGGDPILGTTILDALRVLDQDARTEAVVVVGEVGGVMEEEAAEYAAAMKKPVLAFIAGRSAPPGRRMGHAGAIVLGTRGSGESKVAALQKAGAVILDTPTGVEVALQRLLQPGAVGVG
jgi:succinyl-CoA synthetase alpha subunit